MKERYEEEFDWDCGYPNGFYDLVDVNHPTPYTEEVARTLFWQTNGWTNATKTSPAGSTFSRSTFFAGTRSASDKQENGASASYTESFSYSGSTSNESKYTTATRTAKTNSVEWGTLYTESRTDFYFTTTNGSFTYSSATVQNSKSTTTEATGTGLVETYSTTTVTLTHWGFSADSNTMVTTVTGIAVSQLWTVSGLDTSSSSAAHKHVFNSDGTTSSSTGSASNSASGSHGGEGSSLDEYQFGGFANKGSYTPIRATYSIGLLSGETFYYITDSAGDWGSPESLVGPNSTSFSFTYKRFDNRIAENVIGKWYGKEVSVRLFNDEDPVLTQTDFASTLTTVFQEKILTGTSLSLDSGTTGKMFNIWSHKWRQCFYTNTHTIKLDSSEIGLPYDATGDRDITRPRGDEIDVIGHWKRMISGKGRTIDISTYELSGAIKMYNYTRSPILGLPQWAAWVWGSAQNGYISPLTSSFHTADPEFSSWSKTGTKTGTDAGTLSIGLANNFVKAEVPKLYKSNSATSTTYTFSVMGEGDGSAKDSGVWYLHQFSEACMKGVRLNPFSKDYMIDDGAIFNGAHSQREYVIHGAAANEQKLVLKEKVSSGYSNAETKFTFAYSKGESNITTITVSSGKVYGVFVERPALSDVLGPDSPVRVIVADQQQHLAGNFINAKNGQAAKWMNYSPPASSTADWSHYIQVHRPWETSGGGGGGGGGGGYGGGGGGY